MVDVAGKPLSVRVAVAQGELRLQPATLDLIEAGGVPKGDVLAVARVAGIQAAKRTGELIPLCHPLPLSQCAVEFEAPPARDRLIIRATVRVTAQTGVEMEALTAVSVAALTLYDMCKAVDKGLAITDVKLVSKTKLPVSGPYRPAQAG